MRKLKMYFWLCRLTILKLWLMCVAGTTLKVAQAYERLYHQHLASFFWRLSCLSIQYEKGRRRYLELKEKE